MANSDTEMWKAILDKPDTDLYRERLGPDVIEQIRSVVESRLAADLWDIMSGGNMPDLDAYMNNTTQPNSKGKTP